MLSRHVFPRINYTFSIMTKPGTVIRYLPNKYPASDLLKSAFLFLVHIYTMTQFKNKSNKEN